MFVISSPATADIIISHSDGSHRGGAKIFRKDPFDVSGKPHKSSVADLEEAAAESAIPKVIPMTILYDPRNKAGLLFGLGRGSAMFKNCVVFRALLCGAVPAIVAAYFYTDSGFSSPVGPYLSFLVALMLTFRTNTACTRLQTARTQLHDLQSTIRSLVGQSCVYIGFDGDAPLFIAKLSLSFFYLVCLVIEGTERYGEDPRHRLESMLPIQQQLAVLLTPEQASSLLRSIKETGSIDSDVTTMVALWLQQAISSARKAGAIDGPMQVNMDQRVQQLVLDLNRLTISALIPLPYPYAQMVLYGIVAYSINAPFGMVASLGWVSACSESTISPPSAVPPAPHASPLSPSLPSSLFTS
jgi:predicted membrane chloride channel (bestrophin family)